MTTPPILDKLLALPRIEMKSIRLAKSGRELLYAGMNEFGERINQHFGKIPLPEVAVENDDATLYLHWTVGEKTFVVRLEGADWNFV